MVKRKWCCKDVCWYSTKYKKPIAYSTVADSAAISLINQPNMTAFDLMNVLISGKYIVSLDMVKVVQAYIDRRLGEEILITLEV